MLLKNISSQLSSGEQSVGSSSNFTQSMKQILHHVQHHNPALNLADYLQPLSFKSSKFMLVMMNLETATSNKEELSVSSLSYHINSDCDWFRRIKSNNSSDDTSDAVTIEDALNQFLMSIEERKVAGMFDQVTLITLFKDQTVANLLHLMNESSAMLLSKFLNIVDAVCSFQDVAADRNLHQSSFYSCEKLFFKRLGQDVNFANTKTVARYSSQLFHVMFSDQMRRMEDFAEKYFHPVQSVYTNKLLCQSELLSLNDQCHGVYVGEKAYIKPGESDSVVGLVNTALNVDIGKLFHIRPLTTNTHFRIKKILVELAADYSLLLEIENVSSDVICLETQDKIGLLTRPDKYVSSSRQSGESTQNKIPTPSTVPGVRNKTVEVGDSFPRCDSLVPGVSENSQICQSQDKCRTVNNWGQPATLINTGGAGKACGKQKMSCSEWKQRKRNMIQTISDTHHSNQSRCERASSSSHSPVKLKRPRFTCEQETPRHNETTASTNNQASTIPSTSSITSTSTVVAVSGVKDVHSSEAEADKVEYAVSPDDCDDSEDRKVEGDSSIAPDPPPDETETVEDEAKEDETIAQETPATVPESDPHDLDSVGVRKNEEQKEDDQTLDENPPPTDGCGNELELVEKTNEEVTEKIDEADHNDTEHQLLTDKSLVEAARTDCVEENPSTEDDSTSKDEVAAPITETESKEDVVCSGPILLGSVSLEPASAPSSESEQELDDHTPEINTAAALENEDSGSSNQENISHRGTINCELLPLDDDSDISISDEEFQEMYGDNQPEVERESLQEREIQNEEPSREEIEDNKVELQEKINKVADEEDKQVLMNKEELEEETCSVEINLMEAVSGESDPELKFSKKPSLSGEKYSVPLKLFYHGKKLSVKLRECQVELSRVEELNMYNTATTSGTQGRKLKRKIKEVWVSNERLEGNSSGVQAAIKQSLKMINEPEPEINDASKQPSCKVQSKPKKNMKPKPSTSSSGKKKQARQKKHARQKKESNSSSPADVQRKVATLIDPSTPLMRQMRRIHDKLPEPFKPYLSLVLSEVNNISFKC